MGENVVRGDEIGTHAKCRQSTRECGAEKLLDDLEATRAGGGRGACRGFDSGAGAAPRLDESQQGSVVRRYFEHMALVIQSKAFRHTRHVALAMREPGRGEAAEIGIVGVEQFVRA